mmetsp:Transcript_18761/g.28202  ORF Transcript_18761/g.28202 Transcript_18761/m.28202 type:complete len:87 (-) Transcript_18761:18-278(-)
MRRSTCKTGLGFSHVLHAPPCCVRSPCGVPLVESTPLELTVLLAVPAGFLLFSVLLSSDFNFRAVGKLGETRKISAHASLVSWRKI